MPILPGTRLGAYEVLSLIGAGGMGEVYRARDTQLGREVAIKLLPPECEADSESLARFEKEARLASSLNHPNIITIYGVGQAGAISYIAMELVNGQTLHEALVEGPLPMHKLVDVAAQIAAGLAKAHQAGIVHRDLKPKNVMITADGLVKILDFGVGKLARPTSGSTLDVTTLEPSERVTRPGIVVGTTDYMSPEQASGRPVDYRSDQFSFGSVMYEMATGKRPFHRPMAVQTLAAIIEDEPPSMTAINPRVPPPVRAIVERCLAKDPEHRYTSTEDLARELASAQQHTSKPPVLTPAVQGRRGQKRVWVVAVAALVVVLAMATASPIRDRVREWLAFVEVPAQKEIAVLPFRNVSGNAADEPLCDGLSETLTSKLTQLEQFQGSLRVVASSEVRRQEITSAEEARRAFGVNLAITGSFQRTGESVRLHVNLVDARTLQQLRSFPIDTQIENIAVMQDGVVSRVAEMLELELQPQARQTLAAGGTTVPAAYVSYLEGRGYLQRHDMPGNVDNAINVLRQALAQDRDYPLAHAALGEAYWRKYELTKDPHWIEDARESCTRALALNNRLAPVYVTIGLLEVGTGRYEQAIVNFQRALSLDPRARGPAPTNDPLQARGDAYRELARAYEALGKLDEAESTYRQAIAVRSNDSIGHAALGRFFFRQGRYAEAEAGFRVVIQLTPDNAAGYSSLGGVYQVMGRYEDAVNMLEKSLAIQPSYAAYSNLGSVYFFAGRYADAARMFERALKIDDRDHRIWRNLAAAYHWTPGEREKARAAYERAAEMAEAERRVNPRQAALLMRLADCYAMLDRREIALSYARQALALAPNDVTLMSMAAEVYEQLGDREQALKWVGRALGQGYSRAQVERTPALAALRKDSRFNELTNP